MVLVVMVSNADTLYLFVIELFVAPKCRFPNCGTPAFFGRDDMVTAVQLFKVRDV